MRLPLLWLLPLLIVIQEPAPEESGAVAPAPGTAPAGTPPSLLAPLAHAEDVVDYTMRATLDPKLHTIHGEGTIVWRNTSQAVVHDLWMHLYLNAFKNEKSVFLRDPVGAFRGGGSVRDWGYIDVKRLELRADGGSATDLLRTAELHREGDADETDAHVPLPRDVAPGETITLDMTWDDKLPSVVERTGYEGSYHFAGQWFPKIARLERDGRWAHFPFHHLAEFYADFGTYDVTVDVPDTFTIGACGLLVAEKVEGGRRVERHVQGDIHDFAFTAWDQFQRIEADVEGVAVTVLFPRGFTVDAQRELATMRFAIPYFNQRYGAYPYPVLTIVHPPTNASETGGMEYPTLITTGGPWYGPPGVYLLELVTIHEYGHQYFYGLLASDEVTWPFLDEGLNSYAEQDGLRHMMGPGSAVDLFGLSVSDAAAQGVQSRMSEHNERVAQPAWAFVTGGDYGNLVYARTLAAMETLRRVYGDDAMARAMATYTSRYRFRHPTPDDLLSTFEEVLGKRPADMLRIALFDKGWVDYAIADVTSRKARAPAGIFDEAGKRETVAADVSVQGDPHEGSVLVVRKGTLSFPVGVELTFDDGSTELRQWDGEDESTRIYYQGPRTLVGAVVDPGRAVLVDDNLTNNHRSAGGGGGAPRAFERLWYWAQLFVQAVGP